jgi:hypothetical protein
MSADSVRAYLEAKRLFDESLEETRRLAAHVSVVAEWLRNENLDVLVQAAPPTHRAEPAVGSGYEYLYLSEWPAAEALDEALTKRHEAKRAAVRAYNLLSESEKAEHPAPPRCGTI